MAKGITQSSAQGQGQRGHAGILGLAVLENGIKDLSESETRFIAGTQKIFEGSIFVMSGQGYLHFGAGGVKAQDGQGNQGRKLFG